MRDRSPHWLQCVILGLQLLPVVAIVVALIAPGLLSYLLLPCLVIMAILFPVLGFKFCQQALSDFGREMYLSSRQTTRFNQHWYDEPIAIDDPEPEAPMDRERAELWSHLDILNLGWPVTPAELTSAYRQRARETHPDLTAGDETEFVRVNQAYGAVKAYLAKEAERQA
ncbi:MAG: J domain-containing protein [Coleofasciculaceae cyanobacterium RL_1_1]|nr:J domain-containing protein [Coleofasciculaceae cyanobacterium RL_1_1]